MRRAIMTGATGALGRALIDELTARGIEVLVLTHASSARNAVLPRHPLVQVRLCGLEELSGLKAEEQPWDVFYHFAWAGTTGTQRNDALLQADNVRWAVEAVRAARRMGCSCFIGAGSQAEYGPHEGLLAPETPVHPVTGYGMGKLAAGLLTRLECSAAGMRHCWVRIVSLYGPGDWVDGVIPSTLRVLRQGGTPQLTPGGQRLDVLYSADAARAFRLLGESSTESAVYVLGSGEAPTLREILETLRDEAAPGAALDFGALPYREGQAMCVQADIRALTRDTGWKPEISLREGMRRLCAGEAAP